VLRLLCRNPDGLFWAGDTAQTISLGSVFTFADLSSFLYRYEVTGLMMYVFSSTDLACKRTVLSPNRPPAESKFFQLLVNYRSPGGVVDCAHSIIELLRLFPSAVDDLKKERGINEDMKPVFFGLNDEDGSLDKFFMVGSR
ncbi:hypothetical protein K488DRAFT_54482, partial [Vararia minispora EC-137]